MSICEETPVKFRILCDKNFKQAPYFVQVSYDKGNRWSHHPHAIHGKTLEECERNLREYESRVAQYSTSVEKEFYL